LTLCNVIFDTADITEALAYAGRYGAVGATAIVFANITSTGSEYRGQPPLTRRPQSRCRAPSTGAADPVSDRHHEPEGRSTARRRTPSVRLMV
jgi:hypothetical protein